MSDSLPSGPESTSDDQQALSDAVQQVAKGSTQMSVGSLLGKTMSLVLQVVLSRALGPMAYGIYTLGQTVVRFVHKGAGLGLESALVRFGADQLGQGQVAHLKGTLLASLAFGTGASVVGGVLLFFAADPLATSVFGDPALGPVLRLFALSLPFMVLIPLLASAARAFHRMDVDARIRNVFLPLFNLAFVAVAFVLGFRLGGAVVAFVLAAATTTGIGVYLLWRIFPDLTSELKSVYQPGRLLRFSLPMLGAGMMGLLMNQVDRLMLGVLATSQDVGIYSAAAVMASQLAFVLQAINASFSPLIASLYHRGRIAHLRRLFKITTRWIVTLTLPACIVLVLFAPVLMGIYGPGFRAGASVLSVLALAYLIDASVGSSGYMLQMSDHTHVVLANNIAIAALNVGLNIWLIQWYGMVGAAIATGAAIGLVNVVKLIEVRWLLGLHPYEAEYGKPLLAGGVSAAAGGLALMLLPGPWSWIVGLPATFIAYVGVLYAFGVSDEDDIVLAPLRARLRQLVARS
jgi:O-antigen/teichoic acid export membrane protein